MPRAKMLIGGRRLRRVLELPLLGICGFFAIASPTLASGIQANDVGKTALEQILKTGASIDELAEEISSLLLGRDNRVLKWRQDIEPVLTVAVTRGRSHVEAAKLENLLEELSRLVVEATGTHWEIEIVESVPTRLRTSEAVIRVGGWNKKQPDVGLHYQTYCAEVSCLGFRTATYPLSVAKTEAKMLERGIRDPQFETSGKEVSWFEIANGRGNELLQHTHFETAHSQAHIFASSEREIIHTYCFVARTEAPRWLRSQFLECFLRSLGFVGSSRLYPKSVLGVRLPERPDLFLNNKERVSAEEHAANLPNDLQPFDLLALRVHADGRLKPGADQEETRQVVAQVLSDLKNASQ
ncbi:hypothetical protein BN1012_Phect2100 [Candidatus Phaeomarinobacter ectocarpi]|uniref:Uncharacterized protein n=1 Tax=Candidatus Phaeomarinibacter ectocarpi TaxID=1458461 RepID=X5M9N6_9HYPH|nr:hypothetical protein [Candidatus Phaeomarinobacter ectocarpi]CDO60313.1 hypothetical protein BN1012_Phect2100 [Candidatus Phaeomarinobacter ectocarpi]